MEKDIFKKLKTNIYIKPSISHYNKLYNSNKNYNNMLNELLDNNSIDNVKNVMISELDIKISNSQNESLEEIEQSKITKISESKKEFKNELKDSIIKFLQKNKDNSKSFHDIKNENKEFIPNINNSLNLATITPTNNRLKTFTFNKHKDKINNFIKFNRKSTKTKTLNINDNIKRNQFLIKKLKTKNIQSIIGKFNNTTNKKIKNNNSIFNKPHKSLLVTVNKKYKKILSIYENKKATYSNLKSNKNKSFIKENFNRSNTLRISFKNSFIKNNSRLKYHKILTSNSKPKEKTIQVNNKYIFLPKTKYAKTENNCNIIKNKTFKKYDINKNRFIQKKIMPTKYRNLTLKEINTLHNVNNPKNNYFSLFNNTYTKEKEKNYSTIVYEKKKLKIHLNKKLKIHEDKNILSKNPINIVNININNNNNYIMNINNNDSSNMIEHKKIKLSSNEGKMKKLFSFQNFLKLNENYKKNILKRIISKEKNINNKDIKNIHYISNIDTIKKNFNNSKNEYK